MTRPATSSLYYEVYKTLPNDTDFTIFKRHGIEGCNFAFIRNVRNYHTANDDFAHCDPGSLQHHGDHAWQMLGALANCDLDHRTKGAGHLYRHHGTLRAVVAGLDQSAAGRGGRAVSPAAAGKIASHSRAATGHVRQSFAAFPAWIVAALLVGEACDLIFRLAGIAGKRWSDDPLPITAAYMQRGRGCCAGDRPPYSARHKRRLEFLAEHLDVVERVGLLIAALFPGGSYLFILPGLAAAIASLLAALVPQRFAAWAVWTACCGRRCTGLLWWPVVLLLYDGLGFKLGIVCSRLVPQF